jgi:hypothetical protein
VEPFFSFLADAHAESFLRCMVGKDAQQVTQPAAPAKHLTASGAFRQMADEPQASLLL